MIRTISYEGWALDITDPSNIEGKVTIFYEKNLSIWFPFSTPSSLGGMDEECSCIIRSVDLKEDLQVLGSIKLDIIKLLDDSLIV